MHNHPATPLHAASDAEPKEEEFVPLTPEQAQHWRSKQPVWSLWRMVWVQFLVGVVLVAVTAVAGCAKAVVLSVVYGALASLAPAALALWGHQRMTRGVVQLAAPQAATMALVSMLLWEGVKVLLAIVMLWLAPRILADVSWAAMLIAFVVVIKAGWLALPGWRGHRAGHVGKVI